MTSTLQNRLVGTVIVVALVVIFLPEVLDGEKDAETPAFVEIPPAPAAIIIEPPEAFPQEALDAAIDQEVTIVEAVALDDEPVADTAKDSELTNDLDTQSQVNDTDQALSEALEAEGEQLVPTQEDESQESALAQALDTQATGPGWVVQLGSFRYEKNVNELIATLNEAGYRAFSRPAQTSAGQLNKVFVGPELDRERLEQALPELQELTKLKGKITAFQVSD